MNIKRVGLRPTSDFFGLRTRKRFEFCKNNSVEVKNYAS